MIKIEKSSHGFLCENCMGKDDIKEILVKRDGRGTIIKLCAKCRTELTKMFLNDDRVSDGIHGMKEGDS